MTILRFRNVVAGLLVAGALVPATGTLGKPALASSSPANGIGIRLIDAPVSARADSRAWSYIIDHLAPGAVIHRRMQVSNTTGNPQHLSLYAAAADITDHRFQFAPGRTTNELSTWTTTNRHAVTLAPHARKMVTTTIRVPADAAPGERYAVVWAEAAKPAPPGGGVAEVNRVGIRIYLSVGQGNAPPSAFTIDAVTAQRLPDGRQLLLVRVHNTGGRALDLSGDLKLTNASGSLTAGPFKAQTGVTLAPGDSGTVTVPVPQQIPDGPWHAQVRLQSGLTQRTTDATVQFPRAAGTKTVKAAADLSDYSLAALATALLLTAAIATWLLLIKPRRRSRQPDDTKATS